MHLIDPCSSSRIHLNPSLDRFVGWQTTLDGNWIFFGVPHNMFRYYGNENKTITLIIINIIQLKAKTNDHDCHIQTHKQKDIQSH